MSFTHDISETEEYYSIDQPRTARMLTAIAIFLALSPVACSGMYGPIWASTSSDEINHWYDITQTLGAGIFLLGPLILFLANRMHRWLWHGEIRWSIIALQWIMAAIFLVNLSEPWRQTTVSGWQTNDCAVIEHPVFSACFYLSTLLSCILWITFRGDRRWFVRALYEILPFVLITAGLYYLSIADRPQFNWG